MGKPVKQCSVCVLDQRYPGIAFDEDGICNHCRAFKAKALEGESKEIYEIKFRDLIDGLKGRSTYDCLAAYSGGKDSTYLLHLLTGVYHMKVLAYTFDNWFQSPEARENIRAVTKGLGVDHITLRPNFNLFAKIIRAVTARDFYSAKALERASSVCTTCISLIRYIGLQMAVEKEIPFIMFGFSPGQSSPATSIFKTNAKMVKKMQDSILRLLIEHVGSEVRSFFLEQKHFERIQSFPYSINPLAFHEYDEDLIYRVADSLGWKKPHDTDSNSTNCLLNSLANKVHLDTFGYNPYAYEVAQLVRSGSISREEGLIRLAHPQDEQQIANIAKALGLA